MRNGLITILAVAAALSSGLATPSSAITNGGFETGNFSGWDTTGITSIKGSFAGGPTEGTSQAQIETGDVSAADLETFLGLSPDSLKGLGNGTPTTGSAIKQAFSANLGDVLSFDWNFLTSEIPPTSFNDFSFATLLPLSTLGSVNSLPLVLLGGGFNSQTGFRTFSTVLPSAGVYVLGLGVVHVEDTEVNSGLLVDNVTLMGDTSTTPEPGTLLLLGSGLVGLAFWRGKHTA